MSAKTMAEVLVGMNVIAPLRHIFSETETYEVRQVLDAAEVLLAQEIETAVESLAAAGFGDVSEAWNRGMADCKLQLAGIRKAIDPYREETP